MWLDCHHFYHYFYCFVTMRRWYPAWAIATSSRGGIITGDRDRFALDVFPQGLGSCCSVESPFGKSMQPCIRLLGEYNEFRVDELRLYRFI